MVGFASFETIKPDLRLPLARTHDPSVGYWLLEQPTCCGVTVSRAFCAQIRSLKVTPAQSLQRSIDSNPAQVGLGPRTTGPGIRPVNRMNQTKMPATIPKNTMASESGAATPTDDSELNNAEPPFDSPPAYSVFTRGERRMMMVLVGLAMLFSPLTANIYFPAMSKLEADLDTSAQLINLTITSYLVLQAVAPALFGDLADVVGRRPAFLGMFAVYSAANLGLALQHSFSALLILRMVQSLGASATVAVSYGLVADIVTAAERGGVIGSSMVATNLGPVLAPLIGGAILSRSGSWQWIFWCLLLCGATMLLSMLFLLPETARSIVDNGSIRPNTWRRPLLPVLVPSIPIPRHGQRQRFSCAADETVVETQKRRTRIPNPLSSVRLIFYKDSALILSITGVFYMIYYCLQASIAVLFRAKYPQFSDATVGACYLSIGCGVVVGGYLNGRLMNRNYAVTAAEMGQEVVDKNNNDLSKFPIEQARLRSMVLLQLLHLGPLVAYGWMMEKDVVSGWGWRRYPKEGAWRLLIGKR